MQCPKCQSQDVYLCSTAYEQGTTTSETTSAGSGSSIGASSQGGFAQAQHNISQTHETTHQTEFAKRAAPPFSSFGYWSFLGSTLLLFNILIFWLSNALTVTGHEPAWLAIPLWGAQFFVIWRWVVAFKGRPQYRSDLSRWRKTWICARCSNKFLPDSDSNS